MLALPGEGRASRARRIENQALTPHSAAVSVIGTGVAQTSVPFGALSQPPMAGSASGPLSCCTEPTRSAMDTAWSDARQAASAAVIARAMGHGSVQSSGGVPKGPR